MMYFLHANASPRALPTPPPPTSTYKVSLKKGQEYTFDLKADEEGDDTRCSLPHEDVMAALEVRRSSYLSTAGIVLPMKFLFIPAPPCFFS